MAVAFTRTTNLDGSDSSGGVVTHSGASIGTASADRIIVLFVCASDNNGATITSATIDYGSGDTAMTAGALASTSLNTNSRAFWLAVPTGTTATFKVTFSGAVTAIESEGMVYSVTGSDGSPTLGTDSSNDMDATDPLTTGSITIPSNGGFLAIAGCGTDADVHTWANATKDQEYDYGTDCITSATRTTSGTVTITLTGGNNNERGALSYLIFSPAASGTPYTIAADAGAFTLTGVAALQKITRLSSVGTFTYTGVTATLRKGYILISAVGTFALTGFATLQKISMSAVRGIYTLSGIAAGLKAAYLFSAAAGSYVYTGKDTFQGIKFFNAVGTYVYTGVEATLISTAHATHELIAAVGTYVLGGQSVFQKISRLSNVGVFTYTGVAATLSKIITMVAAKGTYTYTGMAALLYGARKLIAAKGTYTLTGIDATLTQFTNNSKILIAAAGAYVVVGANVHLAFYRRIRQGLSRRITQAKLVKARINGAVLKRVRTSVMMLKKIRSRDDGLH